MYLDMYCILYLIILCPISLYKIGFLWMVTPTAICLAHYAKLDLEKMSAQIKLRIFPAPFLVHMKDLLLEKLNIHTLHLYIFKHAFSRIFQYG